MLWNDDKDQELSFQRLVATVKLVGGAPSLLKMVFCDGCVEGLKAQRLFFIKDERDMRLWNVDNDPHRGRLRDSLH